MADPGSQGAGRVKEAPVHPAAQKGHGGPSLPDSMFLQIGPSQLGSHGPAEPPRVHRLQAALVQKIPEREVRRGETAAAARLPQELCAPLHPPRQGRGGEPVRRGYAGPALPTMYSVLR